MTEKSSAKVSTAACRSTHPVRQRDFRRFHLNSVYMLSQSPLTVCPVVYFGNTVQQVEKNLLRTAEYGSIKKHLISS